MLVNIFLFFFFLISIYFYYLFVKNIKKKMSPPLIQTVPCYQDSHTWHYIMKEMGYGTISIPDLLDSVELSTSGGLIQNSLDSTRVVVNNICATSIIPSD